VVGPLGTFLAEPVWDKEEIVFADLNMDDLVESRVSILIFELVKISLILVTGRWTLIVLDLIRGLTCFL
jgi:hypothetical protein